MVTHQPSTLQKHLPLIIAGVVVVCLAILGAGIALLLFIRGSIVAQSVVFSADKAVYGEKLTATATLHNTGLLGAKYHAVLLVDGVEKSSQDVIFQSKEEKKVDFDVSGYNPGDHTLAIGKAEKSFRVWKPAAFQVLELTVQPESLMVDGEVTIDAKVKNTGELPGDYMAQFTLDGAPLGSQTVTVQPGAEQSLQLKTKATAGGLHEVELGGVAKAYTALRPAAFAAKDVAISKTMAKVNEKVTVSGTVANTGDIAGKYTLQLFVNGKVEQKKDFSLGGQDSAKFEFTLSRGAAGKYTVKVADTSTVLSVINVSRPANGTLLVKKNNGGYGKLTVVNNNTDRDVIVIFASSSAPKTPLLSVYVRAGSKASNIKVKDGTYIMYYSEGVDYDTATKRFTSKVTYGRFNDLGKFKTTKSSSYIYYNIQTLTFKSSSGNSPTTDLDPSNFPG